MATSRVAVVTDSTASLHPREAGRRGIGVVPLHVVVNGESYREGVDLDSPDLVAHLEAGATVSTAGPGPGEFVNVWHQALEHADEVVSLHLSGKLSATAQTARHAAEQSGLPVRVVDSLTLAGGLAIAASAAARCARAGGSGREVALVARRSSGLGQTRFLVETLDYLRHGGRIGAAQAFVGSALAIKPLLRVTPEGEVAGWQKVRTLRGARTALRAWVFEAAEEAADAIVDELGDGGTDEGSGTAVDVIVMHLGRTEVAHELADSLRRNVPPEVDVEVSEVGAVVAAHTGPGTLGVVVTPRVPGDPGRWSPQPD